MRTEIDELMDRDPLSLTKADVEKLVTYLRNSYRTNATEAVTKDQTSLTLADLGLAKPKPALTRRKL